MTKTTLLDSEIFVTRLDSKNCLTRPALPLPTPRLILSSVGSCKVRLVPVSCCRIAARMSVIGSL